MKGMQGSIRRRPTSRMSFAGLRRYPRRQMSVEVLVQDQEGWEVPLESLDFSPAGMFVRSSFLFEVGTVHNLIFRSPRGDELFAVRAQVTRVESDLPGADEVVDDSFVPGMAYEFIDLEEAKQERLCGLVAQV